MHSASRANLSLSLSLSSLLAQPLAFPYSDIARNNLFLRLEARVISDCYVNRDDFRRGARDPMERESRRFFQNGRESENFIVGGHSPNTTTAPEYLRLRRKRARDASSSLCFGTGNENVFFLSFFPSFSFIRLSRSLCFLPSSCVLVKFSPLPRRLLRERVVSGVTLSPSLSLPFYRSFLFSPYESQRRNGTSAKYSRNEIASAGSLAQGRH